MKIYCKAYRLKELMQFPQWQEQRRKEGPALPEDTFVYLWENLTVVKSPITSHQDVLFDDITPAWRDFCLTTLRFAVPDEWDIAVVSA